MAPQQMGMAPQMGMVPQQQGYGMAPQMGMAQQPMNAMMFNQIQFPYAFDQNMLFNWFRSVDINNVRFYCFPPQRLSLCLTNFFEDL